MEKVWSRHYTENVLILIPVLLIDKNNLAFVVCQ